MTAWSDNRYKLVSRDNRETFELYDLLADPYETNDISAEFPEVVAAMSAEIEAWVNSIE